MYEARLARVMMESSGDCIQTISLQGDLLSINENSRKVLCIADVNQILGAKWADFWDGADREASIQALGKAAGGNIATFEASIQIEGRRRWFDIVVAPVPDDSGAPEMLVAILRDITERRLAEEALRESDRRRTEFLAMLAHELRNPLAPIRNAVQILGLIESSDAQLKYLREIINRQVNRLTHLVDDSLDVLRVMQGNVTLKREKVELAAIVAKAIETVRPLVETRRHHLTVSMPRRPVQVEGDATRLVQVLANILNNAAKYTEPGGQLAIVVEHTHAEVSIHVRDTGAGIPAEFLPHIFDLFAQTDRTLDRGQGGLGLGLTLARSLLQMHGGRVEAFSAGLGRGSEFIVRLPAVADISRKQQPSYEKPSASVPQKMRVLVVDDNQDSVASLNMLLTMQGYEVSMALDGPSAIDVALSKRPQIILLDLGLPIMDGYEVGRQLRVHPETTDATMIALTGYGQEDDRRRSSEAGLNYHLVKPVDPDQLLTLLASLPRKSAAA